MMDQQDSRSGHAPSQLAALDQSELELLIRAIRDRVSTQWRKSGHWQEPWNRDDRARLRVWVARVHSPDFLRSVRAMSELARPGTRDGVPTLIWALHEHPTNRDMAAAYLRRFKTPEVVEALIEALTDEDAIVRTTAFDSLIELTGFRPSLALTARDDLAHARAVQRVYRAWQKRLRR